MIFRLLRDVLADGFTLGQMFVDDDFLCFTCEDADRFLEQGGIKVHGQTAIPRGRYAVRNSWSPRFDRLLPEVLRVPGFSGVRIHGGNDAGDTLGCILVGARRTDDGVADCAHVKQHIVDLIADAEASREPIWLEVT